MEAQLLGIVVQKEEPTLEKQKSELTIRVAAGKRQLVDLENEILRLLSESKGSLLDDESLVNTLQSSKVTSEVPHSLTHSLTGLLTHLLTHSQEVTKQLVVAEDTEKKIDMARSGYKAAAVRASIAFFVLDDMGRGTLLTHSPLTHLLTYSLTHSLTHSTTHSPTHSPLTHSPLTHSLTPSRSYVPVLPGRVRGPLQLVYRQQPRRQSRCARCEAL